MLKSLDKKWYVVYTLTRHEKQIEKLLGRERIEAFLPLYTEIRQWSDRKKKVQAPLFPNYLFVHLDSKDFWKVLKTNGVIKFVSNGMSPGMIPNSIIESIRRMIAGDVKVSDQKMKTGEKVRVIRGPFLGTEGHYVRMGRKNMLIVNVELLHRSIFLEINPSHIEKI